MSKAEVQDEVDKINTYLGECPWMNFRLGKVDEYQVALMGSVHDDWRSNEYDIYIYFEFPRFISSHLNWQADTSKAVIQWLNYAEEPGLNMRYLMEDDHYVFKIVFEDAEKASTPMFIAAKRVECTIFNDSPADNPLSDEEISPQAIARDLLSIGAVFLRPDDPFTWASGIKSPIYCDNRLTLSHPAVRQHVEQGLAGLVHENYPACQLVAGTSTAGIAHAALVADLLNLPMCYVRAAAKGHGRGNQIEGLAQAGQKVVVVEDLISTAGSVLEVAEVLRAAGCEVLGICSIFTYGLAAGVQRLAAAGVQNVSLSNYDALIEVALAEGTIRREDVKKLHAFRDNPANEGWMDSR